jgi:hypothetical protein
VDDLFRFVALRAPDQADPGSAIDLANPASKFQAALAGIHQPPPEPRPGPHPGPPQPPAAAVPATAIAEDRARSLLVLRNTAATLRSTPVDQQSAATAPTHPADPVKAAFDIAEAYMAGQYGAGFIWDTSALEFATSFNQLSAMLANGAQDRTLDDLGQVIQQTFGNRPVSRVLADPKFQTDKKNAADTIIALFIHPLAHASQLTDLTHIVRLADLIERVAGQDKALNEPGGLLAALSNTLLLPRAIFPLRPELPKPVGVGNLLVVRQHLKRYELGEIANIENILLGETRSKIFKHAFVDDRTLVTETETTTVTTSELQTTERFGLKTEAENTVKEDINAHAGIKVSAKYGTVELNANADVAYSLSKSQSTKAATDYAKDVTSRAASNVTDRVRRQETTRTTETFEQEEDHGFDNKTGAKNVSGVYQWVTKVYEAQVFNYGKRLLFDLMVPEPAAFLLDALTTKDQKEVIKPPYPFVMVLDTPGHQLPLHPATHLDPGRLTLARVDPILDSPASPHTAHPVTPDDLGPDGTVKSTTTTRPVTPADLSADPADPSYYGYYVALYGATGVKAPPEPMITVSKGIKGTGDDDHRITAVDNLPISPGYRASEIVVRGAMTMYETEDGDEAMWVYVGKQSFQARGKGDYEPAAAFVLDPADTGVDEVGNMPVAIDTYQVGDFAVTIDIKCELTDSGLQQWQIETHSAIMNAYAKLMSDYEDKRAAQGFQQVTQAALGENPDQNRVVERTELKKACISLLAGVDIYAANFDDINVNTTGNSFPRPIVPPRANLNIPGADQEAFIRFFEQAFEWEQIMYLFYPYYWGRRSNWYASATANSTDPLFNEFLKAGAARVVVPVRLQMEADIRYFLMTGCIWLGGGLPEITDTDYLPITDEIKERDNAPGDETPEGDPWEVALPTTLVKLRDDDSLPIWRKFALDGHDAWVPGRMQEDKWAPDYGKIDPEGRWHEA